MIRLLNRFFSPVDRTVEEAINYHKAALLVANALNSPSPSFGGYVRLRPLPPTATHRNGHCFCS